MILISVKYAWSKIDRFKVIKMVIMTTIMRKITIMVTMYKHIKRKNDEIAVTGMVNGSSRNILPVTHLSWW